MGISSARPDDLDDFARRCRKCNHHIQSSVQELGGRYNAFIGANQWGVLDATSLIRAFDRYIHGNDFTARWVAGVGAAFRAAGGGGGLVRLPDRAIKASLRAAGLDHDRHSVTFDKPVAYGSPPTTGYTNDPVNTATGNFVELEHDLVFGGLMEDLTFGRTYNSRSDRDGAFGRGWSSWATARLAVVPDGAEYVGPDGQEAVFPRFGDGYGRVVGVAGLVEVVPDGLQLNWFDGRTWTFDGAGRPRTVTRGPGSEVRMDHDSGGRLSELAHEGGRSVHVEWAGDGERIIALACSDGRRVAYRYDEAGNVIEVGGDRGTRRYDLDQIGRVVSVIDADGVAEVTNRYDDDGRVLEQLSPFGRRTHIAYLPGRVTVTIDDDEDGPLNTYIHDGEGRLIAIVDGDDQQVSLSYDEWGNTASITERNGAVTFQEWSDRGCPVRRVLPTGATYTFKYDGAGRLAEVATSAGAVTRLGYTGAERIAGEVVDAEGGVTRTTVQDGRVRRHVDPDGVQLDFEHDADGNVVAVVDGAGRTLRIERDAAGRVTAEVTPLGRRTAYFYDADGLLVEHRDPAGAAWRYDYTAAGRLVSVTDPGGARQEIRYGEHGDPAATIDALGHATSREYDVFGNLVRLVTPDGNGWEYEYDALMRWTATVDPAGGRWQRAYDVNGNLIAGTDPAGTRLMSDVDAFGRLTSISDGLVSTTFELDEFDRVVAQAWSDGTTERAAYDLLGRRTLVEDAAGAVTRLEYTPAGRLARLVFPAGSAEHFEYDACGLLTARVDGAGRRWEYIYDADRALVETRLPTGEREVFGYDDAGRPAQLSAPGAGTTSYEMDFAGRCVTLTDREHGTRRFEYDPTGRVVNATDANGGVTSFTHDECGRVTRVTDPLGATITPSYDAVGRVVELIDQLGRSMTTTYDLAGRLVERIDGAGRRMRRSYDDSGRVASVVLGEGDPITVEYDPRGRTIAVEEPGSFSHRFGWDAVSRLVERSRDDVTMRWSYDADGRRSAIGYPDGTQTSYTHDAGGYVTAAQHPAVGAIELERDPLGRLVGASAEGMSARWRFEGGDLAEYELHAGDRSRSAQLTRDPVGRIVEAIIDGQAHAYGYDPAGQLVSAQAPQDAMAFHYDANGRLAREESAAGAVDYEYDAAGQLLTRAAPADALTRYEYDGSGRRVRETGVQLDRGYLWNDAGFLHEITRTDGAGEDPQTISVVVDALGELASLDGDTLLWDTAHPLAPLTWNGHDAIVGDGSPWALASAGSAQWLAPDWQGTIGDLARDPWGAVQGPSGGVASAPRLGYRGELEFDAQTWLRQRVYQPASRAFPQPDPLAPVPGTASAANPYHYAANNPISLSDPLGLRPVSEDELNRIRNRMDQNLFENAAYGVWDHSSELSAITGLLALIPTPASPFLAAASVGFAGIAATHEFRDGDIAGGVIELVGAVPGVGGLAKARQATSLANRATAANAARLATWTTDSLATQGAKLAEINALRAASDRAAAVATKLDIAGIPPSVHALTGLGHPWEPEHKQGDDPKQPRPVELRPLKPWPAR